MFGHLGLACLVPGPGVDVLGVSPLVLDQHALVEVQDAGDRLVQQLDVVAHDEQGAPVGPQETHEPGLGVAVEVVGGLVEEQDVAAGKKDAGQLETPALAAREHPDGQVKAVVGQPQPGDELADLGLARVPTGGREAFLSSRVTVDGPLGRIGLHRRPEPFEADRGFVEAPPRQHVCQPAGLDLRGQPARGLGEETDRPLRLDLAASRRQFPAQDSQQARFPRPVTTHQTDLVAGPNAERGVRQSRAAPYFDA